MNKKKSMCGGIEQYTHLGINTACDYTQLFIAEGMDPEHAIAAARIISKHRASEYFEQNLAAMDAATLTSTLATRESIPARLT